MLVFVHGWGLGPAIWDQVRAALPMPSIALDLGDTGAGSAPLPGLMRPGLMRPGLTCPGLTCPSPMLGIGHSFGALWLLHHHPGNLSGFIAINGFARFTAAPGWPAVPPRQLDRTRAAFATRPAAVLDDFRATCGLSAWTGPRADPPADPHAAPHWAAPLAAQLAALATWDERATLRALTIPRRIFAAADDPLLPAALFPAMAELCGGDTAGALSPQGGHVLPLTRPEWCADQIAACAATLPS